MPTGTLPAAGAALHKKVYDEALKGSCKGDKECAARVAWTAVKNAGWSKVGDKWVKKSDVLQEFSMYFSKVGTNTKKWSMTASDTLLDLRDEAMSLELYKSFTDNIEADKPVPESFSPLVTDSFWTGGMPYLSIAHYAALEGEGVPGDVHAVYVDGNQLKAKGIFNETPLGLATWKAVLADKSGTSPFEDKTRVSIGFLDLAHKHGDFVFERKSIDDRCPMCDEGAGNKVYLKGYLVHLAMTRKPVNPRSEVEVDLSMTTRKEDAASIVGEELAENLSEKQKALIGLSDVIVERSDMEDEQMATGTSSDMPMMEDADTVSIEEAMTKKEGGCEHPLSHFLVVGDASKVTTWHLRVKDCEGNVDTRLLGAAKAALTSPGGHRGNKYAGPDKEAAIAKLKRLYKSKDLEWKSDVDEEISADVTLEELSMAEELVEKDMNNVPMGYIHGPTTLKEMMDAKAAKEELYMVQDMWYMTQDAIYNILEDSSITDKRAAITGVLGEFKTMMATKSAIEFFSMTEKEAKSPIDASYGNLVEVMKSAMAEEVTPDEKLIKIQPALNELAETIKNEVIKPVAVEPVEAPPASEMNVEAVLSKAIQPVLEKMSLLEAQMQQMSVSNPAERRVPQPRSVSPLAVKSLVATKQRELSPIEKIAAQSVGLNVSE